MIYYNREDGNAMEQIRLGRTNLSVSRTGFGGIPIQRISNEQSAKLLRRAYEAGIIYYDTARSYSDSEEKIGYALHDVREKIVIATKTPASNRKQLMEHIDTSLRNLRTDYIDVYQMHNPAEVWEDVYEGLLELKQQGKIRHIGITYHSREKAVAAVNSGMFETLQFPLTFLSSEQDLALIDLCREKDVGLLAMKGLAGGLITDASCAFVFLRQYENVVPLWGIERSADLEEFIALENNPPAFDVALQQRMFAFQSELVGGFCRSCGYCMPCPQGIAIPTAARIVPLMNRSRYQNFCSDEFAAQMARVDDCINCGSCKSKCPYELDIPVLLRKQYEEYKILREKYLGAEK